MHYPKYKWKRQHMGLPLDSGAVRGALVGGDVPRGEETRALEGTGGVFGG